MSANLDLHFPTLDSPIHLLPHDGEALYFGRVFDRVTADRIYASLLTQVTWQHDEVFLFNKHFVTDRKIAWFADGNFSYTYSGKTRVAKPWSAELLEIKATVEHLARTTYNSCLLNLYEHGGQGLGWHSDNEQEIMANSIASVSFGAERRFDFRHRDTKETVSTTLEHGSLLIMQGNTQSYWRHQLPKSAKIAEPRINLTFRNIRPDKH